MMRSVQRIKRVVVAGALAAGLAGTAQAADEVPADDAAALRGLGQVFGRQLAQQFEQFALTPAETRVALEGLREVVLGEAEPGDEAATMAAVQGFVDRRREELASAEQAEARAYLERMAAEQGAVTTDSGLVFRQIEAGDGASPTAESTVVAHYHGTLRDGTVFDSSVERGEPFRASLRQVIPCWTEGIAMMRVGGRSKLTCPASIAYGDAGSGAIPGGAAITFEVELLEVVD